MATPSSSPLVTEYILTHRWLYERDLEFSSLFGQRFDIDSLPRWSNPAIPRLRNGNHAALAPDAALIPDQLIQLFDAQRRDGARRKCIDVYGEADERDALCVRLGLVRETDANTIVVLFDRNVVRVEFANRSLDATPPQVRMMDREDWFAAVTHIRRGHIEPWEKDVVMSEANATNAVFYGIRVGENYLTSVARFDSPTASRVALLHVDPDFRKTGFGRSTLMHAISQAPRSKVFGTFHDDNAAMLNLTSRIGGRIAMVNPVRRYVGKWDDQSDGSLALRRVR